MSKRERKDFLDMCEMIAQYSRSTKLSDGKNDCIVFYSSEIDNYGLALLLGNYSIDLLEEKDGVM